MYVRKCQCSASVAIGILNPYDGALHPLTGESDQSKLQTVVASLSAFTRESKESDPADSRTMVAFSETSSEYVSAPVTESDHAMTSDPPSFLSARTSIEEQIELSKSHWSELGEWGSDEDEVAESSNEEVFSTLQMHPRWGGFFMPFGEGQGRSLVVGEKFAEGGQAELYHAEVTWSTPGKNEDDLKYGVKHVVKVFKMGTYLKHLQANWPKGFLEHQAEGVELTKLDKFFRVTYVYDVIFGTLLEDGRFAFLMRREEEDLRSLIDHKMTSRASQRYGPFPDKEELVDVLYKLALGLNWLHTRDIIHRDLKASNVLVTRRVRQGEEFYLYRIADFECSVGVVGTGLFRAPEVLQACKDGSVSRSPHVFTKAGDVYGFGMLCYEVLTGKLPFGGPSWNDSDLVLSGKRPEVPGYVDDWARQLLNWCWQSNPEARPSSSEILSCLFTKLSEEQQAAEQGHKKRVERVGIAKIDEEVIRKYTAELEEELKAKAEMEQE